MSEPFMVEVLFNTRVVTRFLNVSFFQTNGLLKLLYVLKQNRLGG